ncbi:hypothetical protein JT358_17055 [Micrococcales bacterium 31B]|nr:hypothetical protein [Micrococcales bacterium 31B]
MFTRDGFAYTLRVTWRRGRLHALAWFAITGAVGAAVALAMVAAFPTEASRAALVAVVKASSAQRFLLGNLAGPSIADAVVWRSETFVLVLATLGTLFVGTRSTRGGEADGSLELFAATPLTRPALAVATLVLQAFGALVLAVALAAGFLAAGAGAGPTAAAAARVVMICAWAACLGTLLAQGLRSARLIKQVGVYALVALVVWRGVVNTLDWPAWLSPLHWVTGLGSPAGAGWPGLAAYAATGASALTAGLVLSVRRDFDGGIGSETRGRAHGSRLLRGPIGLALRAQRSLLVAWCVVPLAMGLVIGSVGTSVDNLIHLDLRGAGGGIASLLIYLAPEIVTAGALLAFAHARADLTAGHAELLLAGPISRTRWFASHLVNAGLITVGALLALGLGVGVTTVAGGGSGSLGAWAVAGLVRAPATLLIVALAALAFAFSPRSAGPVGFGLLIAVFLGETLVDLTALPEPARNASPFEWMPLIVPGTPATANTAGTLACLALALACAGSALWIERRRDVLVA